MYTATVSPQGQIAIPKKLRDAYDIRPGTSITLLPGTHSIDLVPQSGASIKRLRGIFSPAAPTSATTIEKHHDTFEREWDTKTS